MPAGAGSCPLVPVRPSSTGRATKAPRWRLPLALGAQARTIRCEYIAGSFVLARASFAVLGNVVAPFVHAAHGNQTAPVAFTAALAIRPDTLE